MSEIVSVTEAKATLSRLIQRVCDGEEIVIRRHSRPMARLVRYDAEPASEIRYARGILADAAPDRSLVDELIADHRAEACPEDEEQSNPGEPTEVRLIL